MNNNLSKENYWNALQEKYPQAMAEFSEWIDKYKREIGWDSIFAHDWRPLPIKFHDIPFDMQRGILTRFFEEKIGDYPINKKEAIEGIRDFFKCIQLSMEVIGLKTDIKTLAKQQGFNVKNI